LNKNRKKENKMKCNDVALRIESRDAVFDLIKLVGSVVKGFEYDDDTKVLKVAYEPNPAEMLLKSED
jgi:hypothetical protein